MDIPKKITYRLLLWSVIWSLILGIFVVLLNHWQISAIRTGLAEIPEQWIGRTSFKGIAFTLRGFPSMYWGILVAGLAITCVFLWLCLRSSVKGIIKEQATIEPPPVRKPIAGEDQRRQSLLLLSLLQREARLVDFLEENLQDYDDAQIGAAVRSVQENCKKSLNTYIEPKAVIEQNEGEEITVPEGFDPSTVKLTGNVSGQPPFKGILNHRGWRIGRFDLPTLSGVVNPEIIAPAEVEIP